MRKKDKSRDNGIKNNLKERIPAVRFALTFTVLAVLLIYIGAGHSARALQQSKIDALSVEKSGISKELSDIEDALTNISGEHDSALVQLEKFDEIIDFSNNVIEELKAENEENKKLIDDQRGIIENQKEIIDTQQEIIEKTDSAISEIADIIGANVEPISGESMYNGLTNIEKTEEIIFQTFDNPVQVENYIAIFEEKAEQINEDLQYFPDRPPAPGKITYTFGNHVVTKNGVRSNYFHRGLDIWNEKAPAVTACAKGIVTEVHLKDDGTGLGYYVRVEHGNGYMTLYAHLRSICVNVGDVVEKGQRVGMMGKTGAATGIHVHVEIYYNGQLVDPQKYLIFE